LTEIPPFRDEVEEHAFWSNHELGEELWKLAEPLDPGELPEPRPLKHVTKKSLPSRKI